MPKLNVPVITVWALMRNGKENRKVRKMESQVFEAIKEASKTVQKEKRKPSDERIAEMVTRRQYKW